jgi:hypothetical protein
MRDLTFPHEEAVECFGEQVADFVTAVSSLDDLQLLAPVRTAALQAQWHI